MAASALTDIRLHVGMLANRKIKRLQRELGAEGVLSLIRLWCYCATNEPDGAMIGWEAGDVESAGEWVGERDAFVMQCERIGLLDRLGCGGYEIHDWAENQPWAATATVRSERNRAAAQKRWDRHRSKLNGCDSHAECMHDACEVHAECNAPSLSLPSPPFPSPSSPSKPIRASKPAPSDEYSPDFLRWWACYPQQRRNGKLTAFKAWKKMRPNAQLVEKLCTAMTAQVSAFHFSGKDWVFFPLPATWLNQGRWDDEGTPTSGQAGAASHIQDVPAERRPAAYKPFELPPDPQDEAPVLSLRDVSETARRRLGGGA